MAEHCTHDVIALDFGSQAFIEAPIGSVFTVRAVCVQCGERQRDERLRRTEPRDTDILDLGTGAEMSSPNGRAVLEWLGRAKRFYARNGGMPR